MIHTCFEMYTAYIHVRACCAVYMHVHVHVHVHVHITMCVYVKQDKLYVISSGMAGWLLAEVSM